MEFECISLKPAEYFNFKMILVYPKAQKEYKKNVKWNNMVIICSARLRPNRTEQHKHTNIHTNTHTITHTNTHGPDQI